METQAGKGIPPTEWVGMTPTYLTLKEYAAMRRTSVEVLYTLYYRRAPGLPLRYRMGRKILIKYEDAIKSIEGQREQDSDI